MAKAMHDLWPWVTRPAGCQPIAKVMPGLQVLADAVHLPFDVLRAQHAQAVHAGLLANSMLESRDFERTVDALEHVTLGVFARSV